MGKAATGRRKGAAYHHGNLRAALIRSATEILEKEGIAGLSLRAAAERAGVSRTAPYRHFADKAALLAAVAAEGFRGLRASMLAAVEGVEQPALRMQALGRGYVGFAVANGALFRLMFGPEIPEKSAHPELLAAARGAYDVMAGAMAQAATGAGGAGPPADGALAPVAAWAMVHGLAVLLIDGQIGPEMLGGEGASAAALTDAVTRFLDFGGADA